MKIIVTIIPTDLVNNSLLSSFCPFLQTKNKNQFFHKWWSGNEKYFYFLFIASHALLQSHAEFNRLLQMTFLACYSCSYYSSMLPMQMRCSSSTEDMLKRNQTFIVIVVMFLPRQTWPITSHKFHFNIIIYIAPIHDYSYVPLVIIQASYVSTWL